MATTLQKMNFWLFICVCSSLLLTSGCNGDGGQETVISEDEEEEEGGLQKVPSGQLNENVDRAKKIFYMLPSPIETVSLLKKAGAEYDKSILNVIENATKYESVKSKALNLGIYAADLSYASIFDQTQETMFYVSCTKKLADALGITSAFDSKTMERIEANINNQDSMLNIISDAYWIADVHLKESERASTSALIIAGGWVEGLYIATRAMGSPPNEGIVRRVAEQKYSLNNLYELVSSYESDANIEEIKADLNQLRTIFDALEEVAVDGQTSTNAKTGVTTIGAKKELKISGEQLNAIVQTVGALRKKYVEI